MKLCFGCEKPFAGDSCACPHCGFAPTSRDGVTYLSPVRRYRSDEPEEKSKDTGVQVVTNASIVALLLPFLAVPKLRSRNFAAKDASAQLRSSTPVNAIPHNVMQVDRQLIRMGMRFPFVGTRVVYAVKPL